MDNKKVECIILATIISMLLISAYEKYKKWEEVTDIYTHSIYMKQGMITPKGVPYPYQPFGQQPL